MIPVGSGRRAECRAAGAGRGRPTTAVRAVVLATFVALQACASTETLDYAAVPVDSDAARASRMEADWRGVRIAVGPPSQFPYTRRDDDSAASDAGSAAVEGVYRLFTRVRLTNSGSDTVFVRWSDARLVHGGGGAVALTDARGADAAPEAVPPGRTIVRGLLPRNADALEPGEPIVRLCDGCTYRLRVPVRAGDRRHTFSFAFRLVTNDSTGAGSGTRY